MPPSREYGDIDDQPASTKPYTPIEDIARTSSTATGRSVSCSGVLCPPIETIPPNGMIENETSAGAAASDRGEEEDHLVHAARDDVLLESRP